MHGPAWRFGDLGRRIERSSVVLGLVDACLRPTRSGDDDEDDVTGEVRLEAGDVVDGVALEVLLAANESLVAYRRHHRSDVEPAAATHLLLHDLDNPRSYLASVGRLAEHVAAIDWTEGRRRGGGPGRPRRRRRRARPASAAAHDAVEAFGTLVVETWFATPVNPTVVRGRIR